MIPSSMRIAVLVPCFNEEAAVATVVRDFQKSLPSAAIFVYDNNSTDRTTALAREAGAIARSERRQGKGHVVRRMFADVDADIYVLVDGDATYDAPSAPRMIEALVKGHLDMVVGLRVDQAEAAYRRGHRTGNWMLTRFLSSVFGQAFKDILSGYRVFSRRFVKSGDRDALLRPAARIVQQTQHLARRFAYPRHHPQALPFGKTLALLHGHRRRAGRACDRARDSRRHHLSRAGCRAAIAYRGAVDRIDDRGDAVGVVRPGARYGHARAQGNEAARLSLPASRQHRLTLASK